MDYTAILKMAKSMKRPVIHINKSYMLGSDMEFGTLSMIEISSDIPTPFTAICTNILDETAKNKLASTRPDVFFSEYESIDGIYINRWEEDKLKDNIFRLFSRVMKFIDTRPIIYTTSGLEAFPEFISKVSKIKVDDGLTSYTFARDYCITCFNKVHAINSTDKVSLNIYDIDPISYLYEFIIDKKKYTIKEYIRYRKLPQYTTVGV